MMYATEVGSGSIINIRDFMKICTDIQAILRFGLRNLRGCTVGITLGGLCELRR
jgi:hypothetical protein